MSGNVGVICNDNARYSMFGIRLAQLRTPPNTKLDWAVTSDRILGRNSLAKRALDDGAEWLMFIDDDHVFAEDMLLRLLSHEVEIVGGLYMQRQIPFMPIAYSAKTDDGVYVPIDLTGLEGEGLYRVRSLGTGGMLIRSEVLRAIPYPWFEHGLASEDHIFCDKATELGIHVHVDLAVRLGHMSPAAIWPAYGEDGWGVGFMVADNYSIKVKISPPEEEDETG